MSPNDVMNWVKKISFCKMNIIIEFVVKKYALGDKFHIFSQFRCQVMNLAPFLPLSPNDVMNWAKKYIFL